jgi:uncharacterized protein (TIGR00369 family)
VDTRIREGFARQRFMSLLGATMGHVALGEAEITLPISDDLTQHTGVVHAGAITSIVDSACGAAAATYLSEGQAVVSVEFKVNLLAPATGDSLRAIGRVVRAGRTITVCTGEVWAVTGTQSRMVAVMQATMMAVTNNDTNVAEVSSR